MPTFAATPLAAEQRRVLKFEFATAFRASDFDGGHSYVKPCVSNLVGRIRRKQAVKKSNQGDMDEKSPVFGFFLVHRRLCQLPGLLRLPLLQVILCVDSFIIEMRQGRLSITKSPWFDFFTASNGTRFRQIDATQKYGVFYFTPKWMWLQSPGRAK
jgi:hypothetical protein